MRLVGMLKKNFILLLFVSQLVFAGGTNRTALFSARTTSLNGLYFAGIDGVSNIYLNPAGLSYKRDRAFEITGFFKQEENSFTGDLNGLHKSILDSDLNFGVGLYWSLSENLTAAFAMQLLEDYKVNWPYVLLYKQGTALSSIATDLYTQHEYRFFSPSISYKWNSFSAGITLNIFNVKNTTAFAQTNYNWGGSNGLAAYQFDYSQNAWTWNLNIGLMYQLDENLRLGLSVNSPASVTLKGEATNKLYQILDAADETVKLESKHQVPLRIGIGSVYNIDERLLLNIDFRYNLYKNLDKEIKYEFTNAVWKANTQIPDSVTGLSAASLPHYFNNSFDAGIGLEYKAASDFNVSLGYKFSQTPNSDKTYNLLNPTVSQHIFSCGVVYFDDEVTIEGSVAYYIGVEKKISDSLYKVNNGLYDVNGMIPSITVKYKF